MSWCLTTIGEIIKRLLVAFTRIVNRRRHVGHILDVQVRQGDARPATDAEVSTHTQPTTNRNMAKFIDWDHVGLARVKRSNHKFVCYSQSFSVPTEIGIILTSFGRRQQS